MGQEHNREANGGNVDGDEGNRGARGGTEKDSSKVKVAKGRRTK